MGSSLSTGLTGLRANQQYIDVVGNNIANANTPGYRGQRATFSELLAQTLRAATGPGTNIGGTNPMQVGLGVRIGNISVDTSQGGLVSTGRVFDLAIEGDGFFALTDGTQRYLTRVGSFGLDANSTLVDQRTGLKVLSPSGGTITVNSDQVIPAKATTEIAFKGNLPAKIEGPKAQVLTTTAPFTVAPGGGPALLTSNLNDLESNTVDYVNGDTITINGLDADGSVVNATFTYGTNGTTVNDLINFVNSQYAGGTAALQPDGSITMTANATGKSTLSLQLTNDTKTNWAGHGFATTTAGTDPDTVVSSIDVYDNAGVAHNVTLTYERQVDGSWTLTADMPATEGQVVSGTITGLQFGPNGSFSGVFGPTNQMQFLFSGQPANQSVSIVLGTPGGFDGITQFGDTKSVQAKSQDGYAAGELSSMSFDGDGDLIGFFSNGEQITLAEIGIATMANQDGLARSGDTLYMETPNSGSTILSKGQSGKAGVVRSGVLESSNVDIAAEFVNLIEAQRGFQANARVISTTDAMLSELVNIVR